MLKPILLAVTALASLCAAQSPLNTNTGANNQGNAGNGLYFDLQLNTTVTISTIEAAIGDTTYITAAGTGQMEIWLGPSSYFGNVTNASLWTPVATATTPIVVGTAGVYPQATFTLATPLCLAPGNYGVALKSAASAGGGFVAWNLAYHNGTSCTSTTVPGSCPNSIFSNAEMTLRAGAAQNSFLTGPIFTPRVFNGRIFYTNGGTPISVASWQNYGVGCNRLRTSFHEIFPNPGSLDLNNLTFTLAINGSSGWDVTLGGTPFTAPSATATALTFATGNAAVMATTALGGALPVPVLYPQGGTVQLATDLEINADGFISPSTVVWAAPTIAGFLSGGPRWAPHWKNMDVSVIGGGSVTIETEVATGAFVVSYNAVGDVGAAAFSSFQVAYLPNGNVEYRYGTLSVGGGGSYPVVVGWASGPGALENEVDMSAAGISTQGSDNAELTLAMNARPRLGTTPAFVASNIAGAPFGVSMLDFAQVNPGFNLVVYGAPNCFQYQGAGVAQLVFPAANQLTQAFPIPNSTAFNGVLVYAQMAAFVAGSNPLGLIFSNGTRMFMGSL